MPTAIRREEIQERAQQETRDMDDDVLVNPRAHKGQSYHEIGEDGTPVCRVSFRDEVKMATRRKAIEDYTLAPCQYPECQKTL